MSEGKGRNLDWMGDSHEERGEGNGEWEMAVVDVFNVAWCLFSELVPLCLLSSSTRLATRQTPR